MILHLQLWHFDAALKRRRPSHLFFDVLYVEKAKFPYKTPKNRGGGNQNKPFLAKIQKKRMIMIV